MYSIPTHKRSAPTPQPTSKVGGLLQRACACGQHTGSGECAECRKKRLGLQRWAVDESGPVAAPPIVHEVLHSAGSPLDPSTRSSMEPRFGHDFSQVRVHTDAKSAESAQAVSALAYAVGQHIVFGAGQYRPSLSEGKRLIGHELAHTVQQSAHSSVGSLPDLTISKTTDPAEHEARQAEHLGIQSQANEGMSRTRLNIARQPVRPPAPPPQPVYGRACSHGAADPCQFDRCTQHDVIRADMARALQYVNAAIAALNNSPLSDRTTQALDWYFDDHRDTTVQTARTRLACIQASLQDTQANNRYGCHPDHGDNTLAYVCVGRTAPCSQVLTNVCFTSSHFGQGERERAETVIHECAHRVGMSLGAPASVPDIYSHTSRFRFLDTGEALLNADSYALFAGAIVNGVPITTLVNVGVSGGGAARAGSGAMTWQARLYLGAEFQHPTLRLFNPTLGVAISLTGVPETPGARRQDPPSMLISLVPGFRLGDPRPGAGGGGSVSFFGGPAISIFNTQTRLGAEAGVAVGYRWRWLEVSTGLGYQYSPARPPGEEHAVTGSVGVTFTLP